MKEKTCARCKVPRPYDEFPANDRMRDGRDSWCKPCRREYTKGQRAKDRAGRPPSVRHTMSDVDPGTRIGTCSICGPETKAWLGGGTTRDRWRCSNKVGGQQSRRRQRDPAAERIRKLQSRGIKITGEQFQVLVERQDGHCALCDGTPRQLHMDHDHVTGRPRALLCSTCNTGLGKFGDDPARLRAAADYLDARS